MTDLQRAYSDEDLTAFLDGEADEALMQAIAQDLERDAELVHRLESLDISKHDLQLAFADHLATAPEFPPLPGPQTAPAAVQKPQLGWTSGFIGLGTGIAAGIALAVFFGLSAPAPSPNPTTAAAEPAPIGWLAAVATYQMLYTEETLSGPAAPDTSRLSELSEAVDLDLTQLSNVEGLTFRRAQQLGFYGKTLIQVAYTLPDGTPFAICILRNGTEERAPRYQELQGMQAADWTTGDHGVLIIGGTNAEAVEDLAPRIQELL